MDVGRGQPIRALGMERQMMERAGRLGGGHLGAEIGRDGRLEVADPEEVDALVGRVREPPRLQEQVEALAQIGVADADGQRRALGQAQLGALDRPAVRVDGARTTTSCPSARSAFAAPAT